MVNPWMKFYPADWRADPRLRMCSFAARGMWIDLMSYMHEGEPYGHLTIDGAIPSVTDIAALMARPLNEVRKTLAELEAKQVFSRSESGAIFSRRMVRDNEKALKNKADGSKGGNRSLNGGVNHQDKAQILDARNQNPENKKDRFNNSKTLSESVKEGWSPPKHGAISKKTRRVYIEATNPEWEPYAADYRAVHGAPPNPNDHGGRWFKLLGEATPESFVDGKSQQPPLKNLGG